MTGGGIVRGLRQRAGASIGVLLVAVVAAAAATTGPVYDTAARTSILRDALATPAVLDRAAQVTLSGPVSGLAGTLTARASDALAGYLGGAGPLNRMFRPPLQDVLVQAAPAGPPPAGADPGSQLLPVTWHTGQCAHLRLAVGSCPAAPGQVMVSASYALGHHVRPGDTITTLTQGLSRLNVTGVYVPPPLSQLSSDYWLAGPCADFAHEFPCNARPGSVDAPPPGPDALFTDRSTFTGLPPAVQGQASAWWVLSPGSVQGRDLPALAAAAGELLTDPTLTSMNAQASSGIPQLADRVTSDWSALDVPVILIVGQLLLLAWLLLFLVATDAAEARAAEVALARLRGYGRVRTVAFGLSEPALLLLIAFPAGALAGWAFTAALGRLLLQPGTPVTLTWLAVVAAAAATVGGFAAVAAASRRALRRPVTEQWKRTARDATRRGWTLDAVLLAGAAAGLAELFTGGYAGGARSGSLGLLVPGLLGLAAAVVASRLLPLACRLAFAPTRRGGGTALFLAARHIARRPGGTRTTIAAATAFALATFGLASYAVGQRNITRVATAQTGADGVLTVVAPPGQDLGAIVDRIDPGGTRAAVVDRYVGAPNASILLAVQPARFAAVASWLPGFLGKPPRQAAAALSPPVSPPVQLPATATGLRVRASAVTGVPPGTVFTFWVSQTSAGGQTPLAAGALRDGWLTVAVSGCPCQLTMLSADAPVTAQGGNGSLTLSDPQVRTGRTWAPLAGALASPGQAWQPASESGGAACSAGGATIAAAGSASARWSFTVSGGCGPALKRNDVPVPMPALIATGVTTAMTSMSTLGLDGQALTVEPVALAAAVPGAPGQGIVVDRALALRAAFYTSGGFASEQVWTAPGALAEVKARLAAAKVTITDQATIGQAEQALRRQGPALASVLFLATAGMAAALAAGAAVLTLYQAGRRRRHEYAALVAGRVSKRSLRASLLAEQAVVLGFGALTGVVTGLGAALLTLRNIPEFSQRPLSPPLVYQPPPGQVGVPLLVIGLAVGVAATLAALAVVRAARPELLRQAQP